MTADRFEPATDASCISVLRSRNDFLELRKGNRSATSTLVLQSRNRADEKPDCRVGFIVTKKIGNAVVRNRIKRRLREAVRQKFPNYARSGHDYVIVARRKALQANFSRILEDLKTALDRVHMNGQNPRKQ